MIKITTEKITDIPETMLIPLYCKAAETKQEKPIINDPKAVDMVDHIDYDFTKFNKVWMSQLGVAIRTMIFDREIRNFINQNKNAVIVNLGCGLDTRIERLTNTAFYKWYDLDVPEAIELRNKFFNETESIHFIPKSIFDYSWLDEIKSQGKPLLIVAEGLFMYFEENDLKELFNKLTERFPNAEILFESVAPMMVGRSKQHDAVKHTNGKAEFKWGIKDGKIIENWNTKIQYINQWAFFDYHRERVKNGFLRFLVSLSWFKKNMGSRIIHLKINN